MTPVLVIRLLLAGCTAAFASATPQAATEVRPEFAAISHTHILKKLESSWQCQSEKESADEKEGAITLHPPKLPGVSLRHKYQLSYVDLVAQTEHLVGFNRIFKRIACFIDMADNSNNPEPEKRLRRSKLDKAIAAYVQHNPLLKHEFIGLNVKSDVPKDDPHLTDSLKIDPLTTDLAYVLPPPQSAVGAHWDVPIETMTALLAPGSNLLPKNEPINDTKPNEWFSGMSALIELNPDWVLGGASGTATATLKSVSSTVDGPLALIRLKFHLKNVRDAADDLKAAVQGTVPEGTRYDYKQAVELDLQGEGEVQWLVAAGYAQHYTLNADLDIKERAQATVHFPPGAKTKYPEQGCDVRLLWKGKVEAAGSGVDWK